MELIPFVVSIFPLLLFAIFFDEDKIEAQIEYKQKLEKLGKEREKEQYPAAVQHVGRGTIIIRAKGRADIFPNLSEAQAYLDRQTNAVYMKNGAEIAILDHDGLDSENRFAYVPGDVLVNKQTEIYVEKI